MVWEAMAAVEDMLCLTAMTMMMTPLMMPFVWGILCGMHLVTMQGTQVVCCYAHPCFKGHTVVAIILETAMVAAEDSYSLPDNNDHDDDATDDALHSGCPVWHAPGELTRD
jgi:hypothetical protein